MDDCPCGTGRRYAACCGRFHRGDVDAPTAEELMRSRYSAYAVGDEGYLLRTWHVTSRPSHVRLRPGQAWLRLEVLATTGGDLLDTDGTVEFRAHHDGGVLHELSRFTRDEAGRWVYVGPLDYEVE